MPDTAPNRLTAFAEALTDAVTESEVTVADIAARLELSEDGVRKWMRGDREPPPSRVFAIEAMCECEPGFLSHHLGYLPTGAAPTVAQAIADDPWLIDYPDGREQVLNAYRVAVRLAKGHRRGGRP